MGGAGYRRLLARLEGARTLGVSFGLDRMRDALQKLGSPERRFVTVQVAGTNGKGSTAAMADSILRAAGLRTGLFTSPHLSRFTERIRIDGREVDGDRLAELDEAVVGTGVPLTYFEISAVLGFLAMADAGVEVGVLETGLGGRLDAVTAASPVATAITSIGLDHTEMLGGTLREIAGEKAGIARPGVPLYLGPLAAEADAEIARIAAEVGAPVLRYGTELIAPPVSPALAGAHQRANAALAVALAGAAAKACGRALAEAAIASGLEQVRWPGRLEWLAPDVLADCAHNRQGAEALVAALPAERPAVALVVSVVRGKDAQGMLAALAPRFSLIVVTRSHNDRALPAAELAELAPGTRVQVVEDPLAALALARGFVAEHPGGYVVVAGSIFLVGEIRARLLGEEVDPLATGDPLP
jgi:dihydrofolate synthase/folylpolyglutamate synthase